MSLIGLPRSHRRLISKFFCAPKPFNGYFSLMLRNTFASRLAMSGAGNKTLKELGRWKTVQMIDRYAHLSPEHLAEAIEKIGCKNSTTVFVTSRIRKVTRVL
jgi:site-specific recombinase XerD